MFNVSNSCFPSHEQVKKVLERVNRERQLSPALFQENPSINPHDLNSRSTQIYQDIHGYLNRKGALKNQSKIDKYAKKYVEKNSRELLSNNVTLVNRDSMTVIPVGLLTLSIFSTERANKLSMPWLEQLQSLWVREAGNIQANANQAGLADLESQLKNKEVLLQRQIQATDAEKRNALIKQREAAKAFSELETVNRELAAKKNELNAVQNDLTVKNTELANYRGRVEQLQRSEAEAKEQSRQARERLEKLGPIAPKYQKRPEDPHQIPGGFDVEGSTYARRYNRINEMSELVQKAVECSSSDLLSMADSYTFEQLQRRDAHDPARVKPYHLNKAADLAYDGAYDAHRTAIASYAVLQLLEGASYTIPADDCHREPKVILNDQDLFIQHSKPIRVPFEAGRPPIVMFQNPCSWAEKPNFHNFPEGIDPVSAKLMLNRLTEEEKGHLRNLILDPFMMLDGNLRAAYRFRDQNDERGKLVAGTYDLIHTMSRALLTNYAGQIGGKLMEVFDDAEQKGFIRGEAVADLQAANVPEVSWQPNWEYIPGEMHLAVDMRRSQLATLYRQFSPALLNSTQQPVLADGQLLNRHLSSMINQLRPQYFIKHNFLQTECRMDSLATLIHQQPPSREQSRMLMLMIANYLDKPENRAKFESKIRTTGYSVEQVQQNYRLDGASLIKDDLEIELAAHALGVKIGLFAPGMAIKYNEAGLVEPSLFLGPETKERLYMLSTGGHSFYALQPKLRAPETADRELREAVNLGQEYWSFGVDDEQRVLHGFRI